jgi:hypothetical protein
MANKKKALGKRTRVKRSHKFNSSRLLEEYWKAVGKPRKTAPSPSQGSSDFSRLHVYHNPPNIT